MARGMPPPRPPGGGGGRSQPPIRRQPPPKQPAKPAQRPAKPTKSTGQTTRQAAEQQRKAAKAAAQRQQHRQRQQVFLREAHTDRRKSEAEARTAAVAQQLAELDSILANGLGRSAAIDLEALYQTAPAAEPFDPGPLGSPAPEPAWEEFAPGGLVGRLGGQARRERQEEAARAAWEQACEQWRIAEAERQAQLTAAEQAHESKLAQRREQVEQYNSRIARVTAGLRTREPAVVESFLRTVLGRVPLPAGFPRRYQVTHDSAQERVELRVVLPDRAVVPAVAGYHYQAAPDELWPVPRAAEEISAQYRSVIAQVALLVVRDVLAAEPALAGVTLHGLVDDQDPASGQPAFTCLLRVTADRASFERLELAETSALECLAQLGGELSADPYARVPLDQVAEPA